MKQYTVEQLAEMVQEVNSWDGSLEDFDYMEMEQLDELYHDVKPTEILRMAHFGNFDWNDNMFAINAYGNLESVNYCEFQSELESNHDEIVERYNELFEDDEYNML